ncbi:HCP-like protein [Rhizophagus irregularis]|uniref:HCP-like protein n=1 Tax=Rhizophagus irregularis TaxID=588596 RepID=A0A2N0PV72_9GLOM|nr:HCP-like protein [Rhizophagus irregularis]
MSIAERQTNDFNYVDWIEKAVENNYITYFNYNEFTNKQEFENSVSSVGKIFKANWNNNDTLLVVKTPGLDVKKIINELKMQKEVDFHINILRIYGISKLDNQYSLVLEYTDGGSLYSYLKENFTKLEWNDKYRLALQLASAMGCIHNKGIIHCDLHAYNVLIHKGDIKVADFGLSKKATEASYYSDHDVFGIIPYIDPKYLNNICNIKHGSQQLYKINFKSDIYSIGVLFWQLSSGCRPFYDEGTKYDISLTMGIINGKREEIIDGTTVEYSDSIYTACWADDPNKRPSIQRVVLDLKSIIYRENNEKTSYSTKFIKNGIEKEQSNEDFDNMMENDFDLVIDFDDSGSNTNDFTQNNLVLNLADLTDNVERIDKLIDYIIELHDEKSCSFKEVKRIINQSIQSINKSLQVENIKNQTSSKYGFFQGFLYFNAIIEKRDKGKAFELFSKASKDNYPIAQVYLGKMRKDPKDAFYWYQKSAENGNKLAQFYLGKCYENGNGTEKDDFKAFECYDIAAKNGNKFAQFKLGYFYYNGIGTQIDKEKSIVWYEKSAMQNHSDAQLCLGLLYKREEEDLKEALYWIRKAAENGNKAAQFYLGKYYYYGTGIEKDYGKSFEWYEKSAKQGYNNALYALAHLYIKGRGTEKNSEKAYGWIEKAAENGNKFAQYHLGAIYQNNKGTKKNIKKAIEWYEKSARQEYGIAQCSLGHLCEKGKGVEQDLEKAIYWYKKATENGYEAAYYYLGNIEKDEVKAFEYYKKSAEKGYLNGIYMHGYCYETGIGTEIDKEKAVKWYKIAAERGNKDAQKRVELIE